MKEITFPQRRQRELAWALYITEGYIANLSHTLAVNCVTFNDSDKQEVRAMIDAAKKQALRFRRHLKTIPLAKEPSNASPRVLRQPPVREDGIVLTEFIQAGARGGAVAQAEAGHRGPGV